TRRVCRLHVRGRETDGAGTGDPGDGTGGRGTAPGAGRTGRAHRQSDAVFVASKSAAPRGLVSVPPRQQRLRVRDPLLLTGNAQAEAVYTGTARQANDQLAWIESVELAPVHQRTPEELRFASKLT